MFRRRDSLRVLLRFVEGDTQIVIKQRLIGVEMDGPRVGLHGLRVVFQISVRQSQIEPRIGQSRVEAQCLLICGSVASSSRPRSFSAVPMLL